jgi:hypothetical protein
MSDISQAIKMKKHYKPSILTRKHIIKKGPTDNGSKTTTAWPLLVMIFAEFPKRER